MKLTAHDVRELSEAIREIAAWNAASPRNPVALLMEGPDVGGEWFARVSGYYAIRGDTLGDAVDAAMKAWKEGRDDR